MFPFVASGGVNVPGRKGFGSALLETALPAGSRGGPRLSFDPQGLTYEADIPMVAITSAS